MSETAAPPRRIIIGLAGNPNSGKTSLFNALTGARQHVGNYPGVTVEKREGRFRHRGYEIVLVDLPGTYSLSPYSLEEIAARDFIIHEKPDLIINVVDATNLERNLYLTAQLIDLHARLVVALNMVDMAEERHIRIDRPKLSTLLGAPVVPTVGRSRQGVRELLDAAVDVFEDPEALTRHIHINYGREMEKEITRVKEAIRPDAKLAHGDFYHRWLAARAIENDADAVAHIRRDAADPGAILSAAEASRKRLEALMAEPIDGIVADRLYSFLHGLCVETVDTSRQERVTRSDRIDRILTGRTLGYPVFLFLMWFMFEATFRLSEAPMGWLEAGVEGLKGLVERGLPEGLLRDLLLGGVLDGAGGVVVFLPNILILFFFLALLEDTGYMARAAFLMDRVMHALGLHGKSFISMLLGFGCNVPAIMATRTLENREDRLITILVNPLMSCSARYPVYMLFTAAFFTRRQGLVILSIYLVGMLLAVAMGRLFRRFLFRGESSPFVMELPPYRLPTLRSVLIHMWDRGRLFLQKAGGIILAGTVLVWGLNEFPRDDSLTFTRDYPAAIATHTAQREAALAALEEQFAEARQALRKRYEEASKDDKVKEFVDFAASPGERHLRSHYEERREALKEEHGGAIRALKQDWQTERMSQKYAGRVGRLIEPALRPLGLDWRLGISLVPGFLAKEVVVGSLGVIFGGEADTGEDNTQLREKLGRVYTPLVAYSFMLFTLLYTPCLATVAIIKRETGQWRWALFSIGYCLALAWIVSFLVYQGGRLLGLG